jgi:hypothetical protein
VGLRAFRTVLSLCRRPEPCFRLTSSSCAETACQRQTDEIYIYPCPPLSSFTLLTLLTYLELTTDRTLKDFTDLAHLKQFSSHRIAKTKMSENVDRKKQSEDLAVQALGQIEAESSDVKGKKKGMDTMILERIETDGVVDTTVPDEEMPEDGDVPEGGKKRKFEDPEARALANQLYEEFEAQEEAAGTKMPHWMPDPVKRMDTRITDGLVLLEWLKHNGEKIIVRGSSLRERNLLTKMSFQFNMNTIADGMGCPDKTDTMIRHSRRLAGRHHLDIKAIGTSKAVSTHPMRAQAPDTPAVPKAKAAKTTVSASSAGPSTPASTSSATETTPKTTKSTQANKKKKSAAAGIKKENTDNGGDGGSGSATAAA